MKLVLFLAAVCAVSATTYFAESFEGDWSKRW